MLTTGIQILGIPDVQEIINKVKTFDAFTPDNDPRCEHDFGAFKHNDKNIFWKFDYYDETMTYGSEDASDPEQTTRVLTVMLAEEY